MEAHVKLLKKYFKATAKPSFKNFVIRNKKLIENVSIDIETDTALGLHRLWVNAYNEVILVDRASCKVQAR
jgi:hypothetical protein